MDPTKERAKGCRRDAGSALILTVVLTSLLAIVGVLFLMAARIDKMATSATADNRQLGFAVDSVVSQISDVLAKDLPGFSRAEEYYDYPDANNAWLADLEPRELKEVPNPANRAQRLCRVRWHQISDIMKDVTGRSIGDTNDVEAVTVGEREPIDLNSTYANADADGDGVGDARWFEMPGLASSKGKPIYAAVRIVDNGAMLNVNTGYRFDPTDKTQSNIDGDSQLQVNVAILASGTSASLWQERGVNPSIAQELADYEQEVVWQYEGPIVRFTPFDLSDELELRYRFLINHSAIDTRAENWGRFKWKVITTPVNSDGTDLRSWYFRATGIDPCVAPDKFAFDPNYALRHIATVHNLDRILAPKPLRTGPGQDPNKMVNVNSTDDQTLTWAVETALADANSTIADAAQITANILDYIDEDDVVTVTWGTNATSPFYGFERPCIYLSELVCKGVRDRSTGLVHKSHAVELCKRHFEDPDPARNEWRILIHNPAGNDVTQVITWSGTRQFHVLLSEDSQAALQDDYLLFEDLDTPADANLVPGYDPADYSNPSPQALDSAGFHGGATIELQRKVTVSAGETWLSVDQMKVPATLDADAADGVAHGLQRDILPEKCIFRLWGPSDPNAGKTLGNGNRHYKSSDTRKLQAHPANAPLRNIGELGKIFAKSAYNMPDPCQNTPPEGLVIDVNEPIYQNLFNYLTVIDPVIRNSTLGPDEMRVKGRININTAPVFVLAQLPWMTPYQELLPLERARGIVDYRNQWGAFKSIGGLMRVSPMCRLHHDGVNNLFDIDSTITGEKRGPDLTLDAVTDDLEERDLIFTRISNLVTVRSDVFTAYILVRIGLDGPQKRVIAILDRGMTKSSKDAVRVLGLGQVPDPR